MHHCNNQRMLPMQLCGRCGNEIIIINLQFYELSNSAWTSGQQSFPISCWYAKNVCSGFLVSRHTCDISLFSWKTGRGWKQLWSCFSFWGWTVCYFASTPRTKGYMKMPTWWPTPFWKAHRFVELRDKRGIFLLLFRGASSASSTASSLTTWGWRWRSVGTSGRWGETTPGTSRGREGGWHCWDLRALPHLISVHRDTPKIEYNMRVGARYYNG